MKQQNPKATEALCDPCAGFHLIAQTAFLQAETEFLATLDRLVDTLVDTLF